MTNKRPIFTKREYAIYKEQSYKSIFNSPEEEFEYATRNTKKCSKCQKDKVLIEYTGNTSGSDAFDRNGYRLRRPECKACNKKLLQGKCMARRLAKKQKISYTAPKGTLCAICNKPSKRGDGLVFDHCHASNVFRGYLHNSCNRSLGCLGDNVEGLVRALNYVLQTDKQKIIQDHTGIISILSKNQ